MIFENLLGPTSDRISLDELIYDGTIEGEAIILPPGGMLDYSREMTGGNSFMLSALEEDAEAIVAWDGVESTYSLPKRNSIVLEMDPASVGRLP